MQPPSPFPEAPLSQPTKILDFKYLSNGLMFLVD